MKKILLLLLALIILGVAVVSWIFLGSGTAFNDKKKTLYISSHAAIKKAVLDSLNKNSIIKNYFAFEWLANRLNYWKNIKPGKYDIKRGNSLLTIVRLLRNGQQTPVDLVITKLRTKEDFARLAGSRLEFDSAQMIRFLNSPDSLKTFSVTPETAMALVIPDTYTFFWNTTPQKVYKKLAVESEKFWTAERKSKAEAHGLSPVQAYTLASIVEEETNATAEKGNIASVYLNRVNKGMPLQADPTIKFAAKDFSLKRIYGPYLTIESPYNTYQNKGLPPGPICTPSKKTIDAVINAPATDYLYFVADSSFNGTHIFNSSYEEHVKKAREYQEAFRKRFTTNK
jgi:UPF0755 protein